ncbi:MAG: hypothetical protein H6937_08290 [Burkholderiales bacterium]|jgi:hypothetical protein|nr:hypothetical protein [Burkholderiales bacterium]MCP5252634.1 hypothetical protein [Burkholderiales bacterium]
MAERIGSGYKRLFEIRLLHHYWLDEGKTVFDHLLSQERDKRLLSYDMRSFLEITPTATTEKAFNGLGCIYKNTALGCMVAVADSAVIPDDAMFEFMITVKSAAFYNYTALTLRSQKIYELYHQAEDRIYRYKENVPVLSNLTGVSRGTGSTKALFLSKEFPRFPIDDKVESLGISGGALLQLTGDSPGANTEPISAQVTDFPVFIHQRDVPGIVPPAGFGRVPSQGLQLSSDIDDKVYAFIRLSARRADDEDFSFIDSGGDAKRSNPVFQVRFKNRLTFWQYLNKRTGAIINIEPKPLPLTYFGNAGTKQKPSEGLVKAVKSGDKITQLVSEIFE